MSERSFAAWSVGLALVFAVVVPEPGKDPATATQWQAQHQLPAADAVAGADAVQHEAAHAGMATPDISTPAVIRPAVLTGDGKKDSNQQAFLRMLASPGADYARMDLPSTRVNSVAPSVLPK